MWRWWALYTLYTLYTLRALLTLRALYTLRPLLARRPRRPFHPAHLAHHLFQIPARHARAHGCLLQPMILLNGGDALHLLLRGGFVYLSRHALEEWALHEAHCRIREAQGRPGAHFGRICQLRRLLEGNDAAETLGSFQRLHLFICKLSEDVRFQFGHAREGRYVQRPGVEGGGA